MLKKIFWLVVAIVLGGCSEYSSKPSSFTLPTSNKSIDVVLHRSDVRFLDCATLAVIQTYDAQGKMIDAQSARGVALHCNVISSAIEAGGRVGAAAVVRPAVTKINNSVSAAAGAAANSSANSSSNSDASASATGGQGGAGGQGGQGGNGAGSSGSGTGGNGNGNNGGGNGDGDGTNNGTDHHHDNGDNS